MEIPGTASTRPPFALIAATAMLVTAMLALASAALPGTAHADLVAAPDAPALSAQAAKAAKASIKYRILPREGKWTAWKANGKAAAASKTSKGARAVSIKLKGVMGKITYRVRQDGSGWSKWKSNGKTAKVSGKKAYVNAISAKLKGKVAKAYNLFYRVKVKGTGWTGWAKNGKAAGTAGYGRPVKAVQVKLVKKGAKAPKSTKAAFAKKAKASTTKPSGSTEPSNPSATEPSGDDSDGGQTVQPARKPRYIYKLYVVKDGIGAFYDRCQRTLYLKTGNPDPTSIMLDVDDAGYFSFALADDYADVTGEVRLSDYSGLLKVKGGYLFDYEFENPGKHTLQVREWDDKHYGTVDVSEYTVNVRDYDECYSKWVDDVIAEYTTPRMNPLEKLEAVAEGVRGEFTYLSGIIGDDGRAYPAAFAARKDAPFYVAKRWDSFTSPCAMAKVAKRIGGFDNIVNCYNAYDRGSAEWSLYHSYIRVTYKGAEHMISVCPGTASGSVKTPDYVDFSNTSAFETL